jgi:hypothetical protein
MDTDATSLAYTTDNSNPQCDPQSVLAKTTLTLIAEDNKETPYDINVVSCIDSAGLTVSSGVIKQQYTLSPGPQVVLSLSLEGNVSPADLTGDKLDAIKASIAQVLGVDTKRIAKIEVSAARRRLLAVNLGISVVAESAAAAASLSAKAQQSDFSAAAAGIPGARVGGVAVSGVCVCVCLYLSFCLLQDLFKCSEFCTFFTFHPVTYAVCVDFRSRFFAVVIPARTNSTTSTPAPKVTPTPLVDKRDNTGVIAGMIALFIALFYRHTHWLIGVLL